jgi:hypothetical protein
MNRRAGPSNTRRTSWTYPAAVLLVIGLSAALSHQSEERRLRQVEQDAALSLEMDLQHALEFAVALQSATPGSPTLSPAGDTLIFRLQAAHDQVEELRLYVDSARGGLWMHHSGRSAWPVAATVDGLSAALDLRSDGRPVLWMELSARQSHDGEPPLRHHLFRSILLDAPRSLGLHG